KTFFKRMCCVEVRTAGAIYDRMLGTSRGLYKAGASKNAPARYCRDTDVKPMVFLGPHGA
ncbi:MAG: hypothetical protein ACPH9T_11235, partial [Paracoccaceae bacterium]